MAKYNVPVEWCVWDFVEVEADNFKEAVKYVIENRDEIPLGKTPEYIDGTYRINSEDDIIGYYDCDDRYVEELTSVLLDLGYGTPQND